MKTIIPAGAEYQGWDTNKKKWIARWANQDREFFITKSKGDNYIGTRYVEDFLGGDDMLCLVPKNNVRMLDAGLKDYKNTLPNI